MPPDAGVSAEDWAAREKELLEMEARLVAVVTQNVSSHGSCFDGLIGSVVLTSRWGASHCAP